MNHGAKPVVFISSTSEDLGPYRDNAMEAAVAEGFSPVRFEYWEARDNPPLKECLERVKQADLLVVIVARRYGWRPPEQPDSRRRSITWLECLQALEDHKEVIPFLLDDDAECRV